MQKRKILILGAAYGLLPAMRILKTGHQVTVVCRPEEQTQFIERGATLIYRGTKDKEGLRLESSAQLGIAPSGTLGVSGADIDASGFDLVILAMSEPYFGAPEIYALMQQIADAKLPVLAITNTPPPTFLDRLESVDTKNVKEAFLAWETWALLDPKCVTAASPDAQAVRKKPSCLNELTVMLGSDFKVAPFHHPAHQNLLLQLSDDLNRYRENGVPCRVQIKAAPTLYAPLAKWPMLITGNCRCLKTDGSIIPICDAVHTDIEASESIYNWVSEIVRRMGANATDLVPFRYYGKVSKRLKAPSSYARSIAAKSLHVERIDKLIQLTGKSFGMSLPELDQLVSHVDDFG